MKIAISFITLIPNKILIEFANDIINKTNYNVFIFIDDNSYDYDKTSKIKFIKLNESECINNGFQWVTLLCFNHGLHF